MIKHLLAWFGIALLAVLNGAARDILYKPYTGELAAHQISTVVLIVIITAAAWLAQSRWPFTNGREALAVGLCWMLQTIAFECFVGRVLAGRTWDVVLRDYDIASGRIWVLIPIWLIAVPALVFRARSNTGARTA